MLANKARATRALLLAALATAGCSTVRTVPTVTELPPVVLPARPMLAVQSLTPGAARADVMRAYVVSLDQCVGYSEELELLLQPRPATGQGAVPPKGW